MMVAAIKNRRAATVKGGRLATTTLAVTMEVAHSADGIKAATKTSLLRPLLERLTWSVEFIPSPAWLQPPAFIGPIRVGAGERKEEGVGAQHQHSFGSPLFLWGLGSGIWRRTDPG